VGERLHIAEGIVEELPAEQLNQIVDTREHTELVCTVCSGKIPPESDETVEVIALLGPARLLIIHYAHEECKASGVYEMEASGEEGMTDAGDGDPEAPLQGANLIWVPILRPAGVPRAMLLWEASAVLRVEGAEGGQRDPHLDHMLAHGFVAADGALDVLSGPLTGQWSLRRKGPGQLSLAGPNGPWETFDDVEQAAPKEWTKALEEERRCLVVYGSQLGLERFDVARVNEAIQASQAAVATVPWAQG
jgi:hypothetical protein